MELQKLLSKARRAAEDYDMIEEGDKIAVGLSGGKEKMSVEYTDKAKTASLCSAYLPR